MKPFLPTSRIAILALFLSFLAGAAPAQSATATIFSLVATPPAAIAGDAIVISVIGANFDAAQAVYTWLRDGSPIASASGVGRSTYTVATNPEKTETISIAVEVSPGAGVNPLRSSITVRTLPTPEQAKKALDDVRSNFSLEADPPTPDPGQSTIVKVVTVAFNAGGANYQWYVNGVFQKEASGRGNSEFSFIAGRENEAKTIRVDLTTPEGITRSRSVTIRPSMTAYYWWTDTRVPFWYKGKALPSSSSRISIAAMARSGSASAATYQWDLNAYPVAKASGAGKSVFTFSASMQVEERIYVTVLNPLAALSKNATIAVPIVPTKVGLYAVHPRQGVRMEKQIRQADAAAGETLEFVAAPFFFPAESDRFLRYEWQLNRDALPGAPPDPWHFILRSNAGETGQNRLLVEVHDSRRDGQSAISFLNAVFR
ncbi:MAG: hypothetical protein A3A44_03100 [Candidatus Sungbacteria bacterium RIFCSPLOWO2_01_FULL_60_25]|uniref:Ig-like domain-containing protein n=1 Tax=Candidatus Sungbacteria bacterium RIFCSPLOWO2_01_FULL_60_25 TaxID=1802281 RepID=A0A1G2L9Y8_9BACT|nr:MAG: hypothetical protein A3A44_03100 [Candidatus Sungbacteria bacterium RIFCSPLOWO2_01_FULL_60_25]